LLHDLEELVMLAPWLARHRARLAELAAKNQATRRLATSIDLTPTRFSLGVTFELLIILAVTLGAFLEPESGFGFYFFLVLFVRTDPDDYRLRSGPGRNANSRGSRQH
jgi:hypothetical protein